MAELALEGKTALVTGASRGIGAEVAAALAAAGARVALLARTRQVLETTANRIGNGAFAVECDIADQASLSHALDYLRKELGAAPDIVVNNAGLFTIRSIEETSVAELASFAATNLVGPFALLKAFLGEMRSRKSGHVVTIGSIADRHIFPGNAAYSATKFGSRAIHEVLRAETQGSGIRATLISPAAVDTRLWESIHYIGTDDPPDRSGMLRPSAVASAVIFAVTQPVNVNIDELRLSRS